MASCEYTQQDAYREAYHIGPETPKEEIANTARLVMRDTDVILRIQEIRRPVIRKMQKVFEYTVNDGLREADEMYRLAYANGNEMAMGRAIELKGKFAKLLSEHVDHSHIHRIEVFDTMTVAALTAMRRQIEHSMQEEQKKNGTILVEISDSQSPTPQAPRSDSGDGSHGEGRSLSGALDRKQLVPLNT